MTDRGKRYLELVDEVKQDYKDKLRKNSNITLKGCDYCREINLWTYWQGLGYAENTPEIDILLVGQDWGNPNNPSQTVNVDCEGKTAQIYAVAHCGFYGTKNIGDIPKTKKRKEDLSNQIRDWNSILA